jgi:copper transport protein
MMATQGGSVPRKLLGIVVGAATLLAVLVVGASPADAHAELLETKPANGEVLDTAPTQIYLRFSETIDIPGKALEVFGESGDELDTSEPGHVNGDGSTLGVDLPALDDGAYVVTWRVGSADSHPIQGAFTFRIGAGSQDEANALMARLVSSSGGDTTVGLLYGIDRFADFSGMILLVGGALFVAGLWTAGAADRRARRLIAGGWITVTVATLLGFGLQAAYTAGEGLGGVVDPSVVGDVFDTRAGRVWLVRLLLLVIVAGTARRLLPRPPVRARATTLSASASTSVDVDEPGDAAAGAGAVEVGPAAADRFTPSLIGVIVLSLALLATISLAGHAGSGDLVVLAFVTDLVHLFSICFWLGGLVLLLLVVLRRPRAPGAPWAAGAAPADGVVQRVTGEFSALALVAVGAIVVSGTVQGWRQVGSLGALTGTTYGRLLIAKVVLFGLIMVGAYLSRSLVQKRTAAAGLSLSALRRSVGAEVAIAVVVLGITALLVNTVPAEDAYDPTFSADVHGAELLARVEVDPVKAGPTDIVIDTLDHGGNPLQPVDVTASLSQPAREIGPLPIELENDGTGHYLADDTEIPFPGAWELSIDVRLSEFEQETLTTTIPVR